MQCFVDAANAVSKFKSSIDDFNVAMSEVEPTEEDLIAIAEFNADFDYYGEEIYYKFRTKNVDTMWYDFHMEDVKPFAIGFVVLLLMVLVTALTN